MSNPYNRSTTFLTYMGGEQKEGWKADQLNQLIEKTTHTNNPIADTDEVLWTELEQVFKDSFTNTNVKNDAFMMLQHLTQKDSLDLYISEFK